MQYSTTYTSTVQHSKEKYNAAYSSTHIALRTYFTVSVSVSSTVKQILHVHIIQKKEGQVVIEKVDIFSIGQGLDLHNPSPPPSPPSLSPLSIIIFCPHRGDRLGDQVLTEKGYIERRQAMGLGGDRKSVYREEIGQRVTLCQKMVIQARRLSGYFVLGLQR